MRKGKGGVGKTGKQQPKKIGNGQLCQLEKSGGKEMERRIVERTEDFP